MNIYEEKLKDFIQTHNICAEQLTFKASCHSVQEAAEAANVSTKHIVKNICMLDNQNNLIVAIVKGEDRVSASKIGKALNIHPPRIATPEEILEKTGYVCGGVPSFGYSAIFLVDTKVMEEEVVYTGGGSQNSLMRISTNELLRANGGQVAEIRK